ncbi:TetR/AcrR family transcriptional regulator [Bifidobacterium bombi]|nr:TetR/AcrR family transcriptional regulator [Bifidobacterium bombi]
MDMSRPRRNSNQLPAVDRMENAFWRLLSNKRYSKITVKDIVDMACINRNSFYYHYERLSDLAQGAIEDAVTSLNKALPELVEDPAESWRRIVIQLLGLPKNSTHISHLALVMTPNSSADLLNYTRTSIRNSLIREQHLDPGNLSLTSDILLEFTTAGLMALIGTWPRVSKTASLDELVTIDGAVLARTLYLSIANGGMSNFWTNLLQSNNQGYERGLPHATLNDSGESKGPQLSGTVKNPEGFQNAPMQNAIQMLSNYFETQRHNDIAHGSAPDDAPTYGNRTYADAQRKDSGQYPFMTGQPNTDLG